MNTKKWKLNVLDSLNVAANWIARMRQQIAATPSIEGLSETVRHWKRPPRRGRTRISSCTQMLEMRSLLSNTAIGDVLNINQQPNENHQIHSFSSDVVGTAQDGSFVVTWTRTGQASPLNEDIYARRFHADGTPRGDEFRVNTTTDGYQHHPAIAVSTNGAFVITWRQVNFDSAGTGIYAQRFDASGNRQGGEFRVDIPPSDPQYTQELSKVAMDSQGNFVVTWDSYGTPQLDLSYREIFMRRFNAEGVALSGNILVNTEVAWDQYDPNIDMTADGRFVITWTTGSTYNEVGDHDGTAIFAQRYSSDGTPAGVNFQVNSTTSGNQQWADVAMSDSGGFVAIFMSNPATGSPELNRILGQRYDSNGGKIGTEFVVADVLGPDGITQFVPHYPVMDMSANGDFVAFWLIRNQPGEEWGVYGQQFFANGTADGSEIELNQVLPSPWRQNAPAVAMSPQGDYVLAWQTDSLGYFQVRAQRFAKSLTDSQTRFRTMSEVQLTARPALSWDAFPGAVGYDLWVNNNTTKTSQFIRRTDLTSANFTPDSDWPLGKYSAWVRGIGADGLPSKWSAVLNLQIAPQVSLVPPVRQQNTSRPSLQWNSLTGASVYDLWLNNLSTGQSQVVRKVNIAGTAWTSDSDLPLGKYRVWVRGIDATGSPSTWSSGADFDVVPAAGSLSPSVGTFDRQPTFSWSAVAGAVNYDVFIRDRNTGVTVYYPTRIAATNWKPPANLSEGPYRWWVQARSSQNVLGLWSAPTDVYIGGRTDVLAPTGNTQSSRPEFRWGAVQGAVRYELWVNSDTPQQRVLHETALTGTSFTPANALPGGAYRFWVRAVSASGTYAPWSNTVLFTIT